MQHRIESREARRRRLPLLLATLTTILAACDDSTGVGDPARVSLAFAVTTPTAFTSSGPAPVAAGPSMVVGPPLVLEGTNGTLTIEEIRLIVAEVELDGDDDVCQDSDNDDDSSGSDGFDDDCADFEAPPRFLDLPLDGSPVEAFSGLVAPGTYYELEFEIEDLEDDADDEWAAEIAVLEAAIRDEFPDWPRKATALVVGSFTPNGGTATDFRVYVEAEIEIERALVPPLVVGDDGTVGPELTVDVRPDIWFSSSDGSVMDLSAYDYDQTGMLLEFDVEMEDGFTRVEIDDD
jgi:hypothetical protein